MGMGFAPTWLRQMSPLLHKTTLTTAPLAPLFEQLSEKNQPILARFGIRQYDILKNTGKL